MKQHTRWTRLLATPLAALMLVLAGCETTQLDEPTAAPVESRKPVAAAAGTPQSQVATVDLAGLGAAGAAARAAAPSQRIVYFDFDSFAIKNEFNAMLDGHARALAASRDKRMVVEGHTDERGSREYNLALGQKRADAVRKALTLLGAREDQLEAVSLGEEKPACSDSTEDCWAKNRRGDMLYSGEF